MTRARVVVADDLEPMLSVVASLLENSFEVVRMVADGQSALEAVIELDPDVIILDVSMPGMSGIDVAQQLKNRRNIAKVVFLSVHQDSDIIASCLAGGALGYVMKSQMYHDLVPAIHEALAGRIFLSRHSA